MDVDQGGGGGPVRTCEGYSPNLFPPFPREDKLKPCCSICLEPIEEGAAVTSLLKCEDRHQFHAKCINSWLERNATCPTCRKGAAENPFLKRMAEAPSDPDQQYQGLVAICKTASVEGPPQDKYQNVHRLGELGSCHLVAQAMRTFPNERYIQLLGFEAIEALAANSEPNRNHFENEKAEWMLCRAMEGFPDDRDLQTAGCQAIVALATGHPTWQTRLGLSGACLRVTEMLRRWPQDYGAQLAGLYALNAMLSRHDDNLVRVVDHGAGPLLLHMMRSFWRDLDVLDGAITAVYKLSARGHTERDLLGKLDAGCVLLAVMAAHPDAHDIHTKACFALAKLSWQHIPNRQRLMGLGAPAIITRVMDRHPKSLPIQMAAAAALVSLYMPLAAPQQGCSSTTPHDADNQRAMHQTDGAAEVQAFAAVVRALATFPGEPELEVSCSPALLFLLEASGGQQPVLEDRDTAIRFLRAMRNYLHDEDSQDIYLEVAILVTDEKQAPRQALLEAGLGAHVIELMSLYSPVASLMEKCCMLLSTLTEESSANVAQVWNPANLAALVAVMTAHPGQSTLQHFGLSCLQNLVEEGGAEMRYLLDASVLRLVCLALAYHSVNDDIGNASLGLLATMAANGGVEGQAYVESVMAIVTSVWQQFKDGPVGCGVLKWLALVAEDCTPEEIAWLNSGKLRCLVEEVMASTARCPDVAASSQMACTELISFMAQGGKEAWPSACVLVLGVLKESCMSEPTPSVRTAVRAIGALVDDNPHNRAVLKELCAAEVLREVAAKVESLQEAIHATIRLFATQ